MATQRICDCCGKPGGKTTSVQIIVIGDVEPDRPTETTAEQDLCDGCRDGECDKLMATAKAKHKEFVAAAKGKSNG